MVHTALTVKRDLPNVKVNVNGKVVKGYVRGRKNRFASVVIGHNSWDFTWESIARSLNKDIPLRIE